MRLVFLLFISALLLSTVGCAVSGNSDPSIAVPPVAIQTVAPTPKIEAPREDTAQPTNTKYTDLTEKACKEIEPGPGDEGVIYKAECPGMSGYKVINLSTDHTQGLEITDPAGKKHSVDFRSPLGTVGDLFLGNNIEWRFATTEKYAKPQAFIIRVNVQKQPGNSDKQESNLAVVKLAKDSICVTDFVKPSEKNQNVKARELSDTAAARPCLKSKME